MVILNGYGLLVIETGWQVAVSSLQLVVCGGSGRKKKSGDFLVAKIQLLEIFLRNMKIITILAL